MDTNPLLYGIIGEAVEFAEQMLTEAPVKRDAQGNLIFPPLKRKGIEHRNPINQKGGIWKRLKSKLQMEDEDEIDDKPQHCDACDKSHSASMPCDGKEVLADDEVDDLTEEAYADRGPRQKHPFHSIMTGHGYEHEATHDDVHGKRIHTFFHPKTKHAVSIGSKNGQAAWQSHTHKGGTSPHELRKHLSSQVNEAELVDRLNDTKKEYRANSGAHAKTFITDPAKAKNFKKGMADNKKGIDRLTKAVTADTANKGKKPNLPEAEQKWDKTAFIKGKARTNVGQPPPKAIIPSKLHKAKFGKTKHKGKEV